jgi:hypothetical protein
VKSRPEKMQRKNERRPYTPFPHSPPATTVPDRFQHGPSASRLSSMARQPVGISRSWIRPPADRAHKSSSNLVNRGRLGTRPRLHKQVVAPLKHTGVDLLTSAAIWHATGSALIYEAGRRGQCHNRANHPHQTHVCSVVHQQRNHTA